MTDEVSDLGWRRLYKCIPVTSGVLVQIPNYIKCISHVHVHTSPVQKISHFIIIIYFDVPVNSKIYSIDGG